MSLNPKTQDHSRGYAKGHVKCAAAVIGWGTLLGIAFWAAPYVYALNELIEWR